MKDFLRNLYRKNKRDFDVWNYLWLFSDNNSIDFTQAELGGRFNLPASSLHRILNKNLELINTEEKIFIEYEKTSYKIWKITFYPEGRKSTESLNPKVKDDKC